MGICAYFFSAYSRRIINRYIYSHNSETNSVHPLINHIYSTDTTVTFLTGFLDFGSLLKQNLKANTDTGGFLFFSSQQNIVLLPSKMF